MHPTAFSRHLVTGFAAASVLLAPMGAARAQAPDAATPPAAPTEMHRHVHRVSSHERETVDERIAKLHAELKITPDEETSWGAVAQVMRDNNTAIEKMLADETAAAPKEPTAVDDLKSYQKFAQAHADGLTKLIAAFDSFYAAAPAEQQKLADRVFESFGHKGAAMHRKV